MELNIILAINRSNLLNIIQILTSFLNEFPFWKKKKKGIKIKHLKKIHYLTFKNIIWINIICF